MIGLENLTVQAGDFRLTVDNLLLTEGEYVVVFGPTGSGKSVLLETVAGLRRATTGAIRLADRDVTREPPENRRVGFVQQGSLLFPHLSVADNIGYALRGRTTRADVIKRVTELAERVGAGNLLARWPRDLSGGEQQRVALARALAIEPVVVLLDEPLGALDAPNREDMMRDMRQMLRGFGSTVMHVTHDLDEAVNLADRIVVLAGGVVRQVGSPEEVLRRPASATVARLMGARNIYEGDATRGTIVLSGGVVLRSSSSTTGRASAVIRSEDIVLSRTQDGRASQNVVLGVVASLERRASDLLVCIEATPSLDVRLTRPQQDALGVRVGEKVVASFGSDAVHLCATS